MNRFLWREGDVEISEMVPPQQGESKENYLERAAKLERFQQLPPETTRRIAERAWTYFKGGRE